MDVREPSPADPEPQAAGQSAPTRLQAQQKQASTPASLQSHQNLTAEMEQAQDLRERQLRLQLAKEQRAAEVLQGQLQQLDGDLAQLKDIQREFDELHDQEEADVQDLERVANQELKRIRQAMEQTHAERIAKQNTLLQKAEARLVYFRMQFAGRWHQERETLKDRALDAFEAWITMGREQEWGATEADSGHLLDGSTGNL